MKPSSFMCQKCEKTFLRKFNMERHLKIHDQQSVKCLQCNRTFKFQFSKKFHEKTCIAGKKKSERVRAAKKRIKKQSFILKKCKQCNKTNI